MRVVMCWRVIVGDNIYYIPHLRNPAIWLVEIAFINFNYFCKIPNNHGYRENRSVSMVTP